MTASRFLMPAMALALLLAACGDKSGDPAQAADPASPSAAGTADATATTPALPAKKEGGLFGFLSSDKPAEPELPALDLGEFKIASVTLGSALDKENNVVAAKTVFAPTDAIHAVVLTTGKHAGLTLSAKWNTADGALVAESAQALAPTSATYTAFNLANPAGWPVGSYQVAIAVDGRVLQTRAFEVK